MTNQLTEELVYWEFADPPDGVDEDAEDPSTDPDQEPHGHDAVLDPARD